MSPMKVEEKYEIEDITANAWIQELMNHIPAFQNGFIRVNPSGFVFNTEVKESLEKLRNFEVRNEDIWICTFPKCGTTWTQEMVWCLMNDLDFNTAKTVDLDERMIYLEFTAICGLLPDTLQLAADAPSPRIIKTHLPFDMLPKQIRTGEKTPKIIHVFRNSRDVCVSYYHHWKLLNGFRGGFDLWSKLFLEGYSGFYSPYWKHVESYYLSKNENITFLKYEEMKKDLRTAIDSLSAFLDCKSYSDEEKTQLEEHLSLKNFRQNPALNKEKLIKLSDGAGFSNQEDGNVFVRKGIVGDWKNYFSDEMAKKFEEKDDHLSRSAKMSIES